MNPDKRKNFPEILMIDKPKGITSFDVIRNLRKSYGIKKMGHAGTLDPLASGLMIIGIESGTKKLRKLLGLRKTYIADVYIGKKTTTGDMEGEVVQEASVGTLSRKKIEKTLQDIVGTIRLPIPMYSATKVSGRKMYEMARKGEKLKTVPLQDMTVYRAELLEAESFDTYAVLRVELDVDSGTYIRSVAEEIGSRLGYPAVIKDLRRTKIGEYTVEDARKM